MIYGVCLEQMFDLISRATKNWALIWIQGNFCVMAWKTVLLKNMQVNKSRFLHLIMIYTFCKFKIDQNLETLNFNNGSS